MMFCKSRKLAWYAEPSITEQLKQTWDYKFLELLVVFESKSNVSARLKKAGRTIQSNNQKFLNHLEPLLKTPDKYLAKHVRDTFYPKLREDPLRSKSASFQTDDHLRCPCCPQRSYTPVVTEDDLNVVERHKTDIHFQMHTSEEKRLRNLQWMRDRFLPESEEVVVKEHLRRPKSEPSMQRSGTRKEVPRASNVFESLSTPRKSCVSIVMSLHATSLQLLVSSAATSQHSCFHSRRGWVQWGCIQIFCCSWTCCKDAICRTSQGSLEVTADVTADAQLKVTFPVSLSRFSMRRVQTGHSFKKGIGETQSDCL
ncbi:uncharacterized protein LOC121919056 isoform X2 [Sceloporus undulatus]|uniref:uncharacterized protein LOC121919056 isoform X2 n=1 Tax=Sceloporus undulatus TaxID=8520 RepID=UPI001C4B1746|nr:uncharacterized protein LOC121919056 isoform X2 [Sceloporus undulatus]